MGKSADALKHFESAGYPCLKGWNPADHYVFTVAIRPKAEEACKARCKVKCKVIIILCELYNFC